MYFLEVFDTICEGGNKLRSCPKRLTIIRKTQSAFNVSFCGIVSLGTFFLLIGLNTVCEISGCQLGPRFLRGRQSLRRVDALEGSSRPPDVRRQVRLRRRRPGQQFQRLRPRRTVHRLKEHSGLLKQKRLSMKEERNNKRNQTFIFI